MAHVRRKVKWVALAVCASAVTTVLVALHAAMITNKDQPGHLYAAALGALFAIMLAVLWVSRNPQALLFWAVWGATLTTNLAVVAVVILTTGVLAGMVSLSGAGAAIALCIMTAKLRWRSGMANELLSRSKNKGLRVTVTESVAVVNLVIIVGGWITYAMAMTPSQASLSLDLSIAFGAWLALNALLQGNGEQTVDGGRPA